MGMFREIGVRFGLLLLAILEHTLQDREALFAGGRQLRFVLRQASYPSALADRNVGAKFLDGRDAWSSGPAVLRWRGRWSSVSNRNGSQQSADGCNPDHVRIHLFGVTVMTYTGRKGRFQAPVTSPRPRV